MQSSQRTEYNHALEFAIEKSNFYKKPLIVLFVLTDNFPEANARHYYFMLEGLKEVKNNLIKKNIKFIVRKGLPENEVIKLSKDALITVCDKGYLNIERTWRNNILNNIECPFVEIETNLIIPVEIASNKEEYAAYTFRKKIMKFLNEYIIDFKKNNVIMSSLNLPITGINLDNITKLINTLNIDKTITKVNSYYGGSLAAYKLLDVFLKEKIDDYSEKSNDPTKNYVSHLSPYLHFGQISTLDIALKVINQKKYNLENLFKESAFLEELIVRRELSFNFIYYNHNYNKTLKEVLPEWAYKTLEKHRKDKRDYIYELNEFESSKTHDTYWNAANNELVSSGKLHGYMRMYWGKKILEWSNTPEEAFQTTIYLNNKYALDGRDANSFAGIAWCFGKHDRSWKERNVFGTVRYMNDKGLERKFDMKKYVKKS